MPTAAAWSSQEIDAIVADYLHMLAMELAGQSFNKTAHRTRLMGLLNHRSNPSVEQKHQNISAVMLELGYPYINGYKPLRNYQRILLDVVAQHVSNKESLNSLASAAVEQPAVTPSVLNPLDALVEAPMARRIAEIPADYMPTFQTVKRDYLARESQNRSLGAAGEEFVMEYESRRLHAYGKTELSNKIERVSVTRGDGLGYDVHSFDEVTGKPRFIEVKTTAFGKETPFFITDNELKFSEHESENYYLYRVFEFRRSPKLFSLKGMIANHCCISPIIYRADF